LCQQKESYKSISDQNDHFDPDIDNCWDKGSETCAVRGVVRQQNKCTLAQDGASNCHTLKVGDRVYYTGGNTLKSRLCGRKKLTIKSLADGIAVVAHEKWLVTQSIEVDELAIAK
jgi:hypothetical protein